MNAAGHIASLQRIGDLISAVVRDWPAAEASWKPPDHAWSVLEIICHLGDEEVEDFRARVKLTLENPGADWPPIAPEQWAIDRKYNAQDLRTAVDRFTAERKKSVAWLKSLENPDWSSTHTHPRFGSMRAGDLLASWAAHDALHLRQIAKRMHQLAKLHGGEFKTDYAGQWTS